MKTFNISKYIKSLKKTINKEFKESIIQRKKFRKRTLKSIYDTQILDEKVIVGKDFNSFVLHLMSPYNILT